ncbi:S1C family serine protease [Brotaphodocola sp.]|uniref:S1C family serine protease n=1 Tax=Brotaphodocola sp. TaxID=3073577 RepID=UPI003D7C6A6A
MMKSLNEKENFTPNEYRQRGRSRRKQKASLFGAKKTAALCLCSALVFGSSAGAFYGMQQLFSSPTQESSALSANVDSDSSQFLSQAGITSDYSDDSSSSASDNNVLSDQTRSDRIQTATDAPHFLNTVASGTLISGAQISSGSLDVSAIAETALPSVVAITNISVQEVQRYFDMFGRSGPWNTQLQETKSCGSGVIIANDGTWLYMVTNNHVIENAVTLSVSFVDDSTCKAQLCGADSTLDLAVIKVALSDLSSETKDKIAVVSVGNSSEMKVGNQVVAIGNALGYGQSVTTGIISALNRTIQTGKDSSGNAITSTYIQTDAAINPGNSGGALLNMRGELIGINSAKVSSSEIEGMGYAIPISSVWSTIQNLMGQSGNM